MMTKMTGTLTRVLDDELRVQVGPFEYAILVTEAGRRQFQLKAGEEVTLHISEYLEGGPNANRYIHRRIGFATEQELEFFELFCTVDKIGAKKALKALARPVREIADAISRQDAKWLTTLPGIGATTAETIVTTLKKKVTKFALSGPRATTEAGDATPATAAATNVAGQLIEDLYQALMGVGHTPIEARAKLDQLLQSGKPIKSVEDGLMQIYARS